MGKNRSLGFYKKPQSIRKQRLEKIIGIFNNLMEGGEKMREQSFPTASIEDWVEKSEQSMKGKKIETLEKNTYEQIKLKPLYTKNDQTDLSPFPGQSDFRRGIQPLGYLAHPWKVAQKLSIEGDLREELDSAFLKGQTAIAFEVSDAVLTHLKDLEEKHLAYPFSINAKHHHPIFIDELQRLPFSQKSHGYIGFDPIATLTEVGKDKIEESYQQLVETVNDGISNLPHLRTILVDTVPYHNGGAQAVQELAFAIATGVEHIEELTERGLSLHAILSKLVFQFSIGSNFFMELAKLRAARMLWDKVTEAYGVAEENRGMVISAFTSSFTKTVFDPYVNLLRAGNEAFAAVLGGIQYLHVSPFNEPEGKTTAFSERIARNMQLILRDEAHLAKTIDPAGGSWYVEYLTQELVIKAWELFLEIDEKGGMVEGLKQGWIQTEIAKVREKRNESIATRKQTIVGTNKYADLQGESLKITVKNVAQHKGDVPLIPQGRLSESYEELRFQAQQLKKQGLDPTIGLITLGELKSHKVRTDFIKGFLAPGGIAGKNSDEIQSLDEALNFVKQTGLKHYCLCGANEQYAAIGADFAVNMKQTFPHIRLFVAGIPEERENWEKAGIDGFIHVKSNCYQSLAAILADLEVGIDDEAEF